MAQTWRKVSRLEAEAHPLYGIKNWLAVFAFGQILGAMYAPSSVAQLKGLTLTSLQKSLPPQYTPLKMMMAANLLSFGMLLLLFFTKHPKFRNAASGILLSKWPIEVLIIAVAMPGVWAALSTEVEASFFVWASICAVWITYLQRSRRVRVTFEQLVLSEELASKFQAPRTSELGALKATSNPTSDWLISAVPVHNIAAVATSATDHGGEVIPSDESWTTAYQEFDGQERRSGLWAKLFSEASGDEAVAKAKYLEHRALEIERLLQAKDSASRVQANGLPHAAGLADSKVAERPTQKQASRIDLMLQHDIGFDGKQYVFGAHRYDKLDDGVAYAERHYSHNSSTNLNRQQVAAPLSRTQTASRLVFGVVGVGFCVALIGGILGSKLATNPSVDIEVETTPPPSFAWVMWNESTDYANESVQGTTRFVWLRKKRENQSAGVAAVLFRDKADCSDNTIQQLESWEQGHDGRHFNHQTYNLAPVLSSNPEFTELYEFVCHLAG